MWISDIYLQMHIASDQRERIAEARCTHMTARAARQRRLLERLARVQHELDATDARELVRRTPQPLGDCR